jgi:hypothetical protein
LSVGGRRAIIPRMTEQEEIRREAFALDMQQLGLEIKAILGYLRHLDMKIDLLQDEVESIHKWIGLGERLAGLEERIKEVAPQKASAVAK